LFASAAGESKGDAGQIAAGWIRDIKRQHRWLAVEESGDGSFRRDAVTLVHTYDGALWNRLTEAWKQDRPRRIVIISPFYDPNAEMIRRVHRELPECKIEIIAQQGTSNLPVRILKRWSWRPAIFEIRNSSRRLHAKLLAWQTKTGTSCLVGSANFTSAAIDGKNAEACLLLPDSGDALKALFDRQLSRAKVVLKDFDPGSEAEPRPQDDDAGILLDSAVLTGTNRLRIKYRHGIVPAPSHLRVDKGGGARGLVAVASRQRGPCG
jgi:hypothetical protein